MKALSKIALLGLVAGLLVTATGCGEEGLPAGKSPEDIITEALLNGQNVTQSVYEMNAKADLKGEVDGKKNDLKGTFNISGTQGKDKMAMKVVVDGTMNDDSVKGNAEMRVNSDGVFAKVEGLKLSDADSQAMIDTMLKEYMNKWVKLSFVDPADVNQDEQMMKIDFKKGDPLPFTNIQYEGNTDILGIKSYHFTADIDEEQMLSLVDSAELANTKKFFDASEMHGDVYVAINEKLITGFGGTMKLNDPEMNGTVELNIKLNPIKADDVKTPKFEKELTENDMAMLMFGGAMTTMPEGAGLDGAMMQDGNGTGLINPEDAPTFQGVPGETGLPGGVPEMPKMPVTTK